MTEPAIDMYQKALYEEQKFRARAFVKEIASVDLEALTWERAKEIAVESGVIEPRDYLTDGIFRPDFEGNAEGTDVHDNWYLVRMTVALRTDCEYALPRNPHHARLLYALAQLAFAEGHATLDTDEMCLMWSSPWNFSVTSPEDYLATVICFDLETDERLIAPHDHCSVDQVKSMITDLRDTLRELGFENWKEKVADDIESMMGLYDIEDPEYDPEWGIFTVDQLEAQRQLIAWFRNLD